MSNLIKRLYDKKLLPGCPSWLPDNIHYLTIMGSQAYHVSNGGSDTDVYGFCIPPKSELFPHLDRQIVGFGKWKNGNERFKGYQIHHVKDVDAEKEYDINIYNIVDYFELCKDCNPNMIDSLYTPFECVIHSTRLAQLVREKRDTFLSKKAWHTFKGYAYAQLHKMSSKERTGKRADTIEKFGFDVKFAYHVYRLIDEVEQILTLGTIDLTRGAEKMKAIRRGEVSEDEIRQMFKDAEVRLDKVYHDSPLSYEPRESEIRDLLFQCLEMHYGDLSSLVPKEDVYRRALEEMTQLIDKYKGLV